MALAPSGDDLLRRLSRADRRLRWGSDGDLGGCAPRLLPRADPQSARQLRPHLPALASRPLRSALALPAHDRSGRSRGNGAERGGLPSENPLLARGDAFSGLGGRDGTAAAWRRDGGADLPWRGGGKGLSPLFRDARRRGGGRSRRASGALATSEAGGGARLLPSAGGCRMGTSARTSVVDPEFRVWGYDNLFVCDASLFPTALGVNPQVPIMALADYAATSIAGITPPTTIDEGPVAEARRRLGLPPDAPISLPPG
ncbi:MAG: hypothetical protein HC813_02290 [Planctomycetes bacterium]|nr:hypothetical protein [Planctomycetota bacterium]